MPPVPVLPPVKMQTSSASASPSTMATPTRPLFPGVCRLAQMLPVANTQPSISSTRVCLKYYNALAVISVLHLTHSMPCMMLLTPRVADCTTRHVLKFCSPAGPWTDPSSSQISPQRSPASAGKPNTSYAAATDAAAPALGAAVFTAGSAMPRSPGQQQGSAHSEATQRRSLLRRLSSKAMQVRHLSHGSPHPRSGTGVVSCVEPERPAVCFKGAPCILVLHWMAFYALLLEAAAYLSSMRQWTNPEVQTLCRCAMRCRCSSAAPRLGGRTTRAAPPRGPPWSRRGGRRRASRWRRPAS